MSFKDLAFLGFVVVGKPIAASTIDVTTKPLAGLNRTDASNFLNKMNIILVCEAVMILPKWVVGLALQYMPFF